MCPRLRPPSDFAAYPLDPVVGPDAAPLLGRELRVGRGVFKPLAERLRRRSGPNSPSFAVIFSAVRAYASRGSCVWSTLRIRATAFPFVTGDPPRHATVNVHSAATVAGLREGTVKKSFAN